MVTPARALVSSRGRRRSWGIEQLGIKRFSRRLATEIYLDVALGIWESTKVTKTAKDADRLDAPGTRRWARERLPIPPFRVRSYASDEQLSDPFRSNESLTFASRSSISATPVIAKVRLDRWFASIARAPATIRKSELFLRQS